MSTRTNRPAKRTPGVPESRLEKDAPASRIGLFPSMLSLDDVAETLWSAAFE